MRTRIHPDRGKRTENRESEVPDLRRSGISAQSVGIASVSDSWSHQDELRNVRQKLGIVKVRYGKKKGQE